MNDTQRVPAPGVAGTDEAPLRYARLLEWATRIGLVVLLASFAAYVSGILPSLVPPEQLPGLWHQPLQRYLELTAAPTGWQWVMQLRYGDVLGLTGIAVLAGCSGLCLLSLLPLYRARGDAVYLGLCLAQIGVLTVAASGVFGGGH